MQTRFTALGVGVVILAMGLGLLSPAPPARASDTGKVIAALAIGALVYGIADHYDRDRCYPSHGYHYRPDYAYRGYGHGYGYSRGHRAYERGYDDGFDDGYTVGWHDGRRVGQREGYSWGYRDGDRHGKAVGYRYGYRDGRHDQRIEDRYLYDRPPRSTCGRPGPRW